MNEKLQYFVEALKGSNSSIAMPNELFMKLLEMIKDKELNSVHVGFTYSYIFLQTYMYRFTIYGRYIPSVSNIKELLNYAATNKTIDYIIKENGLLEKKGILSTDNNFPFINEMVDNFPFINEMGKNEPEFITRREFCDVYGIDDHFFKLIISDIKPRSNYKFPEFAFSRFEEEVLDGSFYDTHNTTLLDIETFLFCVQIQGIGVNGFYLYAYLKHQNFKHKDDFRATYKRISAETGLSAKTVQRVMNVMREHNLVTTVHNMEYFSVGIREEDRKASTHKVNTVEEFSVEKVEYEKLGIVKYEEHKARQKEKYEHDGIDIDISELPF